LLHAGPRKLHVLPSDGLHPQEAFLRALPVREDDPCRSEDEEQREHEGQNKGEYSRLGHRCPPSSLIQCAGIGTAAHLRPPCGSHTMTAKQTSHTRNDVMNARGRLSQEKRRPSSDPPP